MMDASALKASDPTKLSFKIQTFVFLNLQTTGFSNPRITELSMIAVSRNDLLKMGNESLIFLIQDSDPVKLGLPTPPRILPKLCLLFNPIKSIEVITEEITGLSNETLEHLPPFSKASAEIIDNFLKLPEPVCLVAHNGNGFHFNILKAEINNVEIDISKNILCADTLTWARNFEKNEIKKLSELAKDFKEEDFLIAVQPPKTVENENFLNERPASKRPKIQDFFFSSPRSTINLHSSVFDSPPSSQNTPPKTIPPNNIPSTPTKTCNTYTAECALTPQSQLNKINNASTKQNAVRDLFNDDKSSKDVTRKYNFSQASIYERIFRMKYEEYRAENNTLALMQICGTSGTQFVDWADKNCKHFKDVIPRWSSF